MNLKQLKSNTYQNFIINTQEHILDGSIISYDNINLLNASWRKKFFSKLTDGTDMYGIRFLSKIIADFILDLQNPSELLTQYIKNDLASIRITKLDLTPSSKKYYKYDVAVDVTYEVKAKTKENAFSLVKHYVWTNVSISPILITDDNNAHLFYMGVELSNWKEFNTTLSSTKYLTDLGNDTDSYSLYTILQNQWTEQIKLQKVQELYLLDVYDEANYLKK